jgi:TolB-like protein
LKSVIKAFGSLPSIIFLSLAISSSILYADPLPGLLILPFNIHADRDMKYLKLGISEMLSARLQNERKIRLYEREKIIKEIREDSEITKKAALSIADRLGADFVLFGSITLIGESISTDAFLIDVKKKVPIATYSANGQKLGDNISHINELADRVQNNLFGSLDVNASPSPSENGTNQERRQISQSLFNGLWRSNPIEGVLRGIAVADIDGDGQNEIVFIDHNTVYVAKYQQNLLVRLYTIKGKGYDNYIHVDAADINGSGRAEIYLTNITRCSSFLDILSKSFAMHQ